MAAMCNDWIDTEVVTVGVETVGVETVAVTTVGGVEKKKTSPVEVSWFTLGVSLLDGDDVLL